MRHAMLGALVALVISFTNASAASPGPTMAQYNTLKAKVSRLYTCLGHVMPVELENMNGEEVLIQNSTNDENTHYITITDKKCMG